MAIDLIGLLTVAGISIGLVGVIYAIRSLVDLYKDRASLNRFSEGKDLRYNLVVGDLWSTYLILGQCVCNVLVSIVTIASLPMEIRNLTNSSLLLLVNFMIVLSLVLSTESKRQTLKGMLKKLGVQKDADDDG